MQALPMETAPKDGSMFLLAFGADGDDDQEVKCVAVCFWDREAETYLAALPRDTDDGTPTWGACSLKPGFVSLDGWMPLPGHPRADMEWQRIETAPKDGTWILAYGNHRRGGCDQLTIKWEKWEGFAAPGQWISGDDGYAAYLHPTHWMPLPSRPSPEEDRG